MTAAAAPAMVGCTLRAYARAKLLPTAYLCDLGLYERRWHERTGDGGREVALPAVWMPFWDEHGRLVGTHVRIGLAGHDRFRWAAGSRVHPYGLWRLGEARRRGLVTLVEGESDCHTLWLHDEPAVGIPGASTWRDEWCRYLDGLHLVYLVAEPDRGGTALVARLNASPLRPRVRVIALPGGLKDPSDLYRDDITAFPERWEAARRAAVRLSDLLPPPPSQSPGGSAERPTRRAGESGGPRTPADSTASLFAAVKAHVRIEDYLGSLGLRLRGRPPRLMCQCPVHDDHEPSCAVNTDKQLWYCFGCGRGGDIWTLDRLLNGPLQAYVRSATRWRRSTARAGA